MLHPANGKPAYIAAGGAVCRGLAGQEEIHAVGPALNPTMRSRLLMAVLRPAEYHRVTHGRKRPVHRTCRMTRTGLGLPPIRRYPETK